MQLEVDTKFSNRNYGRLIPIFYCNQGDPFFTLGPNYVMAIGIAVLMNLLSLAFLILMARQNAVYNIQFIILMMSIIFVDIFFFLTSFLNPGLSIRQIYPSTNQYCSVCNIYQEQGQRHCSECNICIRKYDHHCPWLGTCIGKNNLVPFYLYIASVLIWFVDIFATLIYFVEIA